MTRILVYGDSNSWGYPSDGSGLRMEERWPTIMATHLGDVDLIEENLPGRTTVHDDAEHMGEVNNGLRALEGLIRSHAPLDAVIILLGTNDLKARFAPSAKTIAANLGRLVQDIRRVGGASPIWEDTTPPAIFLISPPPLSERAIDPEWERVAEWAGGYEASLKLAAAIKAEGDRLDVPVFDSAHFVESGADDPVHWTEASHLRLGQAVAHWLKSQDF